MTFPETLHVGTSSFSAEGWVGPFYPEGMVPRDFLSHYAKTSSFVEVDSTYYRSPSASLAKKWRSDTPAKFRFALKMVKTVTHDKALSGCEREFDTYMAAASELGEKLAFVVLQFGYFNKSSACPDLGTFLGRLEAFAKRLPRTPRFVVEIRNPKWIGPELLAFLKKHKLIYALTDQEWMPRPKQLWEKFGESLVTGDAAYVRWLGERKRIDAMTKTWDKIVIDRTAETLEWIPIFRELTSQKVGIWLAINNHFAGHAPGSIELLRELWAKQAVGSPEAGL